MVARSPCKARVSPDITLDEIFAYLSQADKPCLIAIDEFQTIAGYLEKVVSEAYVVDALSFTEAESAIIDEIEYEAPLADGSGKTAKVKIVPLQFLKAVLPNPQDLGENYDGETSIGCRIRGKKDGKEHTYYVYNNCKHQEAYNETGMQGVSYTTGVPAMIGAMMFLKGIWKKPGVWNVEEFDPDPFMEQLNKQGLPWHEVFDGDLEID